MDHTNLLRVLLCGCVIAAPGLAAADHRPGDRQAHHIDLYDPALEIDFTTIDPSRDPGPDPVFTRDPRLNRTETYTFRTSVPGDHHLPRGTGVINHDVTGRRSLEAVVQAARSTLSACTGLAIYLVNGTALDETDLRTVQRLNLPRNAGGLDLTGITTLHLFNLRSLPGGVETREATINGAFLWSNGWRGSAYKHLVLDDLEEVKDGTFCENRFESISLRGARSIGVMAFGMARHTHPPLREIYLPSALTIGSHAFRRNRNLTTVTLPRATVIDSYAFDDCDRIEYVNAPEVRTLGRNVFNDNGSIVSMNLPKLESTGVATWGTPGRIRVLRLPNLVKTYDLNAMATTQFLYAPRLTSADHLMFGGALRALHVPALERVARGAFSACRHLRRIDLPRATDVSPEAFTGLTQAVVTIRGRPHPLPASPRPGP
jgi:hypothetical protein